MDNEEKNVVDLLIKRLELAPTEFFKPSTGTSSEMMYDPTTRELPPYILPQWMRVVRQVMYAASDKDWKRLFEAFSATLMKLAEAEFYNTVDRMKDDAPQKDAAALAAMHQAQAQAAMHQVQSASLRNQWLQNSAAQIGTGALANSLSSVLSSGLDGSTSIQTSSGKSISFNDIIKKLGL